MKKKDFSTIALIIVFFVGVSVLLYPTVSDYWNSLHQSQAIATYADSVENMDEQDYEKLWDAAVSYNQKLFQSGHGLGVKLVCPAGIQIIFSLDKVPEGFQAGVFFDEPSISGEQSFGFSKAVLQDVIRFTFIRNHQYTV